ncbi:MAG: metal ABC transporter permease [Zymomonas mobilis subsp. pomaceae]|uniref:ABC-3 protein n=1 Tax=Zymomonas mobilis subsp. pomaceae (strain ATCC 29192 / DSM 22645 / JCM 10191 / CCUG 17912 / NBRC 13757 / NCIMB 11200 / NRRL B-4491 / Barker I) TaxID=579138 RepID=F8EW18_ZYMMT|nr:metal ABC transporter permease [Zymomonas mobilis]AEI38428.1 ABC-3 protein [Zymomonas mobilis subsp. pomaceae ATCC 29192]MDX5948117.1 metal ABC transporter permease [Zymomonas mobilis subsp. pomaceae]GEB89772.1 zinc ABC transporter permease [Zymomonas mobilis subsp. pomaceae]
MTLWDMVAAPFIDYGFMRHALVGTIALGLGSGPVGVFLLLRRMSLVGDAMSHAVLPGAAIGYLVAGGLSLTAMGIGGTIAGLSVALLSGLTSRRSRLEEDASFACFYLTSLALGVLIVSLRGSNIDLLHVLFGTILAIDFHALLLMGGISTATLFTLAIIWRPLITECFDPDFMQAIRGRGAFYHLIFLLLVVLNLIAGFEALGTLMAVGMMMLPAAIARLWTQNLIAMTMTAAVTAAISGFIGLLVSFHIGLASGPTIILTASILYGLSLFLAPCGVLQKTTISFRKYGS